MDIEHSTKGSAGTYNRLAEVPGSKCETYAIRGRRTRRDRDGPDSRNLIVDILLRGQWQTGTYESLMKNSFGGGYMSSIMDGQVGSVMNPSVLDEKKGQKSAKRLPYKEKSGCSVPRQHPDIPEVDGRGRLDLNQRPLHPECSALPG